MGDSLMKIGSRRKNAIKSVCVAEGRRCIGTDKDNNTTISGVCDIPSPKTSEITTLRKCSTTPNQC